MKIDTGKFSRVSYQIIIILNTTLNQIKDHQRTFWFPLKYIGKYIPVKSCFGTQMRSICVIPKCPP